MSQNILSYFTANKKNNASTNETRPVVEVSTSDSVAHTSGLSSKEHALVIEEIANATGSAKSQRTNYQESDKLAIAKYGNIHGPARAVAKYIKQFPKLSESTVRAWIAKYRKQLSTSTNNQIISIGEKRGRPLSLPVELDAKLRRFILSLREAGGNVNRHVIHGVLMGLIKADLARYGSCLEFNVTRGWINYLYKRMNMARRMVTTSRPKITRSIWEETRFIFLREIAHAVSWHDIPDELIINVDQTPSKFVPTDNVTMAV